MTNSMPEFETDTNCFLIMGSNTSEAHPLIASRIMQAQEERGTKLIVIDPREIQMARLADLYLPFRPGTDVAVFNGLMNVIISEGMEDKEYITSRTEEYESLRTVVEQYPPERVEEISSIPAGKLREAARLYAGAHSLEHPEISPLFADWTGSPPLSVHVGDAEILLDDAARLVTRARENGVDATLRVWRGMPHVFPVFSPLVPEARRAIREIGSFLTQAFAQAARRDSR